MHATQSAEEYVILINDASGENPLHQVFMIFSTELLACFHEHYHDSPAVSV